MKELYHLEPISVATSGLLAWQKIVLAVAREKEGLLFTEEGIEDFAEKLQKLADEQKGRDRKIMSPDWEFCKEYDVPPGISIGHGCDIHFHLVKGCYSEEEDMTVAEKLAKCKELLVGITKSGYIPFASPSPSSSESDIKKVILNALHSIELGEALHEAQYGHLKKG